MTAGVQTEDGRESLGRRRRRIITWVLKEREDISNPLNSQPTWFDKSVRDRDVLLSREIWISNGEDRSEEPVACGRME